MPPFLQNLGKKFLDFLKKKIKKSLTLSKVKKFFSQILEKGGHREFFTVFGKVIKN